MIETLKPCPFCGEIPELDGYCEGSCIDITCCISFSLQKSDVLSLKQRETWIGDSINSIYRFSYECEQIAKQEAIKRWNTRQPCQQCAKKDREIERSDIQYTQMKNNWIVAEQEIKCLEQSLVDMSEHDETLKEEIKRLEQIIYKRVETLFYGICAPRLAREYCKEHYNIEVE